MSNPPATPIKRNENPADAPAPLPAPAPPTPLSTPQPSVRNYLAFFRGRVVFLTVLVLAVFFTLVTLVVLRADLQPTPMDITVTHVIQEIPSTPFGTFLVYVSEPGFQPWNWLIVGGFILIVLFALRSPVEALFIGLAGAGGLLAEIVKNLVDRPRPSPDIANVLGVLKSYSFPSGHVTSYSILYGFLFYLVFVHMQRSNPLRIPLLVFFVLMIILIGPSRIYMGQHWASDVIAGYSLGFAYLLLLIEAYRLWLGRGVKRKT
jgi:membrane-associated phospholipid phosphatase